MGPSHTGRMDEARAYRTESWLRGLATDILDHEACEGCRVNAAQALEFLGTFEDTLQRSGVEDPREAQRRRYEEQAARAAEGRPPRLRLELEAEVVVHHPSQEMQERIWSAVRDAVEDAIGQLGGLAPGSSGVIVEVHEEARQ